MLKARTPEPHVRDTSRRFEIQPAGEDYCVIDGPSGRTYAGPLSQHEAEQEAARLNGALTDGYKSLLMALGVPEGEC
jgi:hypothetical protein